MREFPIGAIMVGITGENKNLPAVVKQTFLFLRPFHSYSAKHARKTANCEGQTTQAVEETILSNLSLLAVEGS